MNTYKVCDKHNDAWVMEMTMTSGSDFYCPDKSAIDLGTLSGRLKSHGCKVLLVNTIEYRQRLTGCRSCYSYLGDYPSGKEVLKK